MFDWARRLLYNNSKSGLTANNTQDAIDEIAVGGGGNVSSTADITDHAIVRGDGGLKNIQGSLPTIDDTGNIDLKDAGLMDTNVTTAVKVGSATDTSLNGTKKDILGGINENRTAQKYLSAGVVVIPTFVDNGNGTVTVGNNGLYTLYDNSIFNDFRQNYSINGGGFTPDNNTTSYLVADYNSGTPILKVITNVNLITESEVVPVFTFTRSGNYICTIPWDSVGKGLSNKLHARFVKTDRFKRQNGLILSETGTRNLKTTAGVVWFGVNNASLTEVDTTIVDNDAFLFYHLAGVWTQTTVTQYNNTQYDDGTDLQPTTNNKYVVNWIFRAVDTVKKKLAIVLGTGDYTLSEAVASQIPSLPSEISSCFYLVGRIIVEKGIDTATEVDIITDTQFTQSGSTSHGDLLNILQAGSGIVAGHISNIAQSIYGEKDFINGVKINSSAVLSSVSTGLVDNDKLPTKGYVDDQIVTAEQLIGMSLDKTNGVIVNTTGTLYYELEKDGGGDIRFIFDNVISTLDCTTGAGTGGKARIAITAGTDLSNPKRNYIYVTNSVSTSTLQASVTIPTGAFGWVGICSVPDATTFNTTGAYMHQRYTDALQNDSRGAISHEREKIRGLGATYKSGINHTVNITTNVGTLDDVQVDTTAGIVSQMHLQTFPAFTSPNTYFVANDSVTPYVTTTNLNTLLTDSLGVSMSGRRFSLVMYGVINKTTSECKRYILLPSGSYGTDSNAISDANNFSDYNIPLDFNQVGFLISRTVLRHRTLSSGTWTLLADIDLRGSLVGGLKGGVSASTEFSDSTFKIFNNADETKEATFDASTITTGLTRDYTLPNESGTLALLTGVTGGQTIIGGVGANDDLTLQTTSNVTKGNYILSELPVANGIVRTNASGELSSSASLDVDNITLTNIETDNFKINVVDTDPNLAADSNERLASQKAIKEHITNKLNGWSWRTATELLDSVQTDAGSNIVGQVTYSADSVTISNGDRLLLIAETVNVATYKNKVFLVGGVGVSITLTLEIDGQAGDGSPTDGDSLIIKKGSIHGDKSYNYDGTNWINTSSLNGALIATNNLSDINNADSALGNLNLEVGLKDLTADEITQLKNIDTSTISTTQWGYLGGSNQPLKVTDDVNFNSVTNANLAINAVLVSDGAKKIVSETKNTAHNKTLETSTANIKMNNAVSVGVLETIARADHIHPVDTSRAVASEVLKKDGTVALTNNWDAGSFKITAETLGSDVVTGTAPLTVASTTKVTSLNADQVDGYDFNQSLQTTDTPTFAKISVDNIDIDGNTISSTDTNGNIVLAPNGTGNIGVGETTPVYKMHVKDTSITTAAYIPVLTAFSPNVNNDVQGGTLAFGKSWATNQAGHLTFTGKTTATDSYIEIATNTGTGGIHMKTNGDTLIGALTTGNPKAKLEVEGGVKIANDSDTASAEKVGTFRYRADSNNSYVDMCMQSGASTYVWENIATKTW